MPRSTTIWPPPAQSTWPTSRIPFAEPIPDPPLLTIVPLLPCSAAVAQLTTEETDGIKTRHLRQARHAGRTFNAHANDERQGADAAQALHQARAAGTVRLLTRGDHRGRGQDYLARRADGSDGFLRQVAGRRFRRPGATSVREPRGNAG